MFEDPQQDPPRPRSPGMLIRLPRRRASRLAVCLVPVFVVLCGIGLASCRRGRPSGDAAPSSSVPSRPRRSPTTEATTSTTVETTTTSLPAPTTLAPPSTAKPAARPPAAPGGGYPTPASTGWARTGVGLAPYGGPSTISAPGTVIDGKDITSCITVKAANVVIKRSRIRCSGDWGINQVGGASGLLVEDVEITSGPGRVDRAVQLTNGATLRRVYIHGTQRGIAVGDNTVVEDSYVGDNVNSSDAHSSAIMTSGGTRHVVVRRNTLQTSPGTNASSAISFYPEEWAGGPNDDFLIDGNLLNSGGGYAVYLGHTPSAGERPNTNFRFTNNRFGTLYYERCGKDGPVASWSNVPGNVWANNTWLDQRAGGAGKTNKVVNPV